MMFLRLTKYLLFAIALTSLLTLNLPFGSIVWKLIFMRIVIELSIIFLCLHILRGGSIKLEWRHPILLALGAYTASLIISALFALSPYRAIWGNLERGEGIVTWFHYIAFLLLTLLVWKKQDWITMFRISLLTGFVLMLYGTLQYLGITYFPPFRILPADRAISLVGNPAFFATHLIFLMMFAFIVRLDAKHKGSKVWEYIALAAVIFAIPTIFMTGTRGAILGIGIGIIATLGYVFGVHIRKKENKERKKAIGAGVALLALMMGTLLFMATKEAPVWKKIIPNVERISSLLSQGIKGTSAEDRLTTWNISYEAWKERPVVGWGPENYLPAFVKYFNPRIDRGTEAWFDRAHNNLIDIAVMQGLLGLITYSAFIGTVVWSALGNTKNELLMSAKPYLVWGLIAYIIQNFFLFDQPLSYLYLMIIAGFLIVSRREVEVLRDRNSLTSYDLVKKGSALGTALFAAYAIYAWNIIPFLQIQRVEAAKKTEREDEVIRLLKKGFEPYNFAQHDLRAGMVDHEYSFQPELFTHPGLTKLSSLLLESIQEARKKDPADPRMLVREIQVLTLQSQLRPELLSEVEALAREGVRFAPKKPVFYYKLSLILANKGKYDEARKVAEEGIALYPDSAKSRFQLGLVLAMGGDSYHAEAVKALEAYEAMDPRREFLRDDTNNYLLIYAIWKDNAKLADAVFQIAARGATGGVQLPYLKTALAYYMEKKQKEEFLTIVESMIPLFPDIADDLRIYANLAKEEKWEIMKNL